MATKVYLGYPPPKVRRWIEEEYRKRKTILTFDDGSTEEYDWSGEVTQQTLIDAGIMESEMGWIKNPVSIQFGTTVTTVGNNAFSSCISLTSISMPNVTTVGEGAFSSCYNLTSVSMPNMTQIGDSAFVSCNSLTSVSMPNVMTISVYVFGYCYNLTSVSMPNVTQIGDSAFFSCERLASVSMPNVTTVGGNAFYGCPLVFVLMPSMTTVGGNVFGYTSDSVEFENQTTSKISEWFGNQVFGEEWGPVTVTCSNGSVYAEWDYSENKWNTEITPAQQ